MLQKEQSNHLQATEYDNCFVLAQQENVIKSSGLANISDK